MQICLLTKIKIGNWHIYGQAYHFMLRTAMVFLNTSGKDWQLAAIPKRQKMTVHFKLWHWNDTERLTAELN